VEFFTANCGICASMEPVLGLVARETDATVAMVNPGTDMRLTDTYTIRSVPTLILFQGGAEVGRLAEGFVGVEAVLEFIAANRS
ncbi:MAG: thioredoxin family protein, partial [Halobacteriales archaeon]|nr:thioredoxin family protein [Halobacteriales archaeon]